MSKKSTGRNGSKKKTAAKSVAQSAVGTIFNIVLVVVAAMLIYRFAVSAYQYGVRIYGEPPVSRCFIFRSFCPTIPKMDLRKGNISFPRQ